MNIWIISDLGLLWTVLLWTVQCVFWKTCKCISVEWNSGSYIMILFSFRGSCQLSIAWEFEFFYILVNTYFLFLSFGPFWNLFTDVVWGFSFYFFDNWWTEQLFICLLNSWIYSFLSLSVSGFFCIFLVAFYDFEFLTKFYMRLCWMYMV